MHKPSKKNIIELSKPLAIVPAPFLNMAKKLRASESKAISLLVEYKNKGLIRRFGAVINHKKAGLKVNLLIAWRVGKSRIKRIENIFSKCNFISHCYLRKSSASWPYNLYTVLHAKDKKTAVRLAAELKRKSRIKDFRLLFTLKEFKKIRMDLSGILA